MTMNRTPTALQPYLRRRFGVLVCSSHTNKFNSRSIDTLSNSLLPESMVKIVVLESMVMKMTALQSMAMKMK